MWIKNSQTFVSEAYLFFKLATKKPVEKDF